MCPYDPGKFGRDAGLVRRRYHFRLPATATVVLVYQCTTRAANMKGYGSGVHHFARLSGWHGAARSGVGGAGGAEFGAAPSRVQVMQPLLGERAARGLRQP